MTCHGYGIPITDADKLKEVMKGGELLNCFVKNTEQKKRYADRQKQVDLAKLRRKTHWSKLSIN